MRDSYKYKGCSLKTMKQKMHAESRWHTSTVLVFGEGDDFPCEEERDEHQSKGEESN